MYLRGTLLPLQLYPLPNGPLVALPNTDLVRSALSEP